MSKQLLLGDEAIAQRHWMPDFQVYMPTPVLLQLRLLNISKWRL